MIRNILSLIILSSLTLFSQSLDSLITEALSNNPQIKAYSEKLTANELKSEQENFLPPLTIGFEISQMPFNSLDYLNKPLSQTLSVSQMFMTGGKLQAMYEASKVNSLLTNQELNDYKLNLIKKIKIIYTNIHVMQHHISVLTKAIETLEKLKNVIVLKVQTSSTAAPENLKIRIKISEYKSELEQMQREIQSEDIMLKSLLGRKEKSELIQTELDHEMDIDSFELNLKSPILGQMDNMIQMNELESEVNKTSLSPDLMAEVMVMRMPRGMILTSSDMMMHSTHEPMAEYMYSLKASITLPFLPWSAKKVELRKQEIEAEIKGLRFKKENMVLEMNAEIEALKNKGKSILTKIDFLNKEIIPMYKQMIELRMLNIQVNSEMTEMVLDDIIMLTMKEEELEDLYGEFSKTTAELEYLTGDYHILH